MKFPKPKWIMPRGTTARMVNGGAIEITESSIIEYTGKFPRRTVEFYPNTSLYRQIYPEGQVYELNGMWKVEKTRWV
jgi:hypothetical protein